jgi:RsiW-degrading membrane proteinase PrsW (M82 family)
MRRIYSVLSICLLATSAARADGGISALGGILDMFLLMIGAAGLFIILLMFSIIGAQKDKPGTSIGTRIGIALAVAYVFLAAFFFAASSESSFWLVPAFTGGGTIALLIVYMSRLRDQPAE